MVVFLLVLAKASVLNAKPHKMSVLTNLLAQTIDLSWLISFSELYFPAVAGGCCCSNPLGYGQDKGGGTTADSLYLGFQENAKQNRTEGSTRKCFTTKVN